MKTVIINKKDNVGVCLEDGERIPRGHKYALRPIACGEYVIKYGEIIGRATKDILEGEWVHTHNVMSHLGDGDAESYTYDFCAEKSDEGHASFMGYKRQGRRGGIRNDIYIIPTVGCVNNVCIRLAKEAQSLVRGSIDGIFALTHQFGCSQLGEDNQNIKKLLCDIALNPNASRVLIVGLGCENNGLDGMLKYLDGYEHSHIESFNCQDVEDEHTHGMEILARFADDCARLCREELDMSELCIGLKCGGSDGFSGLTANPLVGRITDRTVAAGGSAILSEVPEMFGAEQLLMNKCKSRDVFEKYKKMVSDFKNYYISQGFPVYENPSPGNKRGGITTLEEKSLGCIEKAGGGEIVDVLGYGELVKERGVSVLDAPGNDLITSTALAASGCQIVLFTTGRGTPFSTFVPTMKISSNSPLASKKNGWIDFDASTMDEEGLWALVLSTASGEYKCKSEDVREIAFYKKGVTL
ncbi:MAG: altronate dehydratase [Ruminococcaceae bacterium]|nr:altronate dehydratase [Oscillospiraceae bacterium]